MRLDHLPFPKDHTTNFGRRQSDNCIACPDPPPCNCSANEDCIQINRDCNTCSTFKCVARPTIPPSHSSGPSKGALAGAIIGILIFLSVSVCLFLWYRRRMSARKGSVAPQDAKPDVPASAEAVLSRPDPAEKPSPTEPSTVRIYSSTSNTTIDLNPETQAAETTASANLFNSTRSSSQSNPFGDGHSIQTLSTGQGTNVIPIALVPPGSVSSSAALEDSAYGAPQRPARSPELDLNLDHVNISQESIRPAYAQSQRSGVSTTSSRNSYMSNASYASDFLREAPVIVTSSRNAVRQVLGVHKAEMLQAPSSLPSTPMSSDSLKPPSVTSRPSVRSPLAATSFTPADVVTEVDEDQEISVPNNPFNDGQRSPFELSPSASVTTFGTPSTAREIPQTPSDESVPDMNPSLLPWAQSPDSRPSSVSTQAGSVIDIGSATRVTIGMPLNSVDMNSMASSGLNPRSPYRTTMGRLVSPLSNTSGGTLEEQQQRALAHAHAQAQAQGFGDNRYSQSSVLSATSTRADSILESFPFVPPSPISNRPVRSPPRSPLGQQDFTTSSGQARPPTSKSPFSASSRTPSPLDPPDRRFLGLSTASQSSTASSGLGSFPFQIDPGTGLDLGPSTPPSSTPPAGVQGHQRASLDTLAITSDISSYPLSFDPDTMDHYPYNKG